MHWLRTNWFSLVQTVTIISTLAIAISALKSSAKAAKASNFLGLIKGNRDIWGQLITDRSLQSVVRPTISPGEEITHEERQFVKEVIHHSLVSFDIAQMGGINSTQGVRIDTRDIMSLPVFKVVWDELKIYQPNNFVDFMDNCIAGIDLDKPFGRETLVRRIINKVRRGS